ncbi:MAG: glycosyltransferase family 39 protein [Butyrivibrio sp.]|nr:glycosyltransferase family 39 protein [Butyrivibrio sp.]
MQTELSESNNKKTFEDFIPTEPETIVAVLFIIGVSIYYLGRLIIITPWYDELYTYYNFISKGPVYSAIHWPLPNNHVGYSVLSGFLYYLGNSYIALRGVSYICAVVNLILIYRICRKFMQHYIPVAVILLYASMQLINELSIQGRGYTLGITCFLTAIIYILILCDNKVVRTSDYVMFVGALTLGLYTVPSNIYWVIPLCFAGGLYLLIKGLVYNKKSFSIKINPFFIRLFKIIGASAVAAVITGILYLIIWLAIGSNLLIKENVNYEGFGHVGLILKHPFEAAGRGIKYMTDQPYIQSVDSEGFLKKLAEHFVSLNNYFWGGFGYFIVALVVIALVLMFIEVIMHFDYQRTGFTMIVMISTAMIPVMLTLTLKLPYFRVLSYAGVLISICICMCFEYLINYSVFLYNRYRIRKLGEKESSNVYSEHVKYRKTKDVWYDGIGMYIPFVVVVIFSIFMIVKPSSNAQFGDREHSIELAMSMTEPDTYENICVLDCDQQYLLKFLYDIDCENTEVTDSDYVIVPRKLMSEAEDGDPDFWKYYSSYETINWDYIKECMNVEYENSDFVVYAR